MALQTDKSDVRSEVTSQAVANLPLAAYRNFQNLIDLVPGATPANFKNSVGSTPARALTTNINGTARNSNNARVDGATNVFIWLPHHMVYVPPVESINTVNITTGSFDAEQGMAGGAAVTVATKSGTNEFHGSAFHYHDNHRLKTRNFFLPPTSGKAKSIFNIFGGTLGGPVIKDKLFFFGSFEGTLERAGITRSTDAVPTAAIRAGDFSGLPVTIYDPTTGNPDGTNRQPFAGNRIPVNRINPISNRIQNLAPLPNQAGTSQGTLNNYFSSGTEKLNRYNYDFKANWNPTRQPCAVGEVQPHGCRRGIEIRLRRGVGRTRPEQGRRSRGVRCPRQYPHLWLHQDFFSHLSGGWNHRHHPHGQLRHLPGIWKEDRQRNLGHPEHE